MPEKKRLKGPYGIEETKFLKEIVYSGLLTLVDIGGKVNYEEMCNNMIHSTLPYTTPEWDNYWVKWKENFKQIETRDSGIELYKELIRDLKNKGLPPSKTIGLTGNYSDLTNSIIEETTTE